jgi:hypothetical protein
MLASWSGSVVLSSFANGIAARSQHLDAEGGCASNSHYYVTSQVAQC